jgi:hypothetical protein
MRTVMARGSFDVIWYGELNETNPISRQRQTRSSRAYVQWSLSPTVIDGRIDDRPTSSVRFMGQDFVSAQLPYMSVIQQEPFS